MMNRVFQVLPFIYFFWVFSQGLIRFLIRLEVVDLMGALLYLIVACSFLLRKPAKSEKVDIKSTLIALIHLSIPLAYSFQSSHGLLDQVGEILTILGTLISSVGVIDLWESFGIFPANRKIKSSGAYSFVRHPIYFGYLVTSLGIILITPSLLNLLVFMAFLICTFMRVEQEEILLRKDQGYRNYSKITRFKVLPWLV